MSKKTTEQIQCRNHMEKNMLIIIVVNCSLAIIVSSSALLCAFIQNFIYGNTADILPKSFLLLIFVVIYYMMISAWWNDYRMYMNCTKCHPH